MLDERPIDSGLLDEEYDGVYGSDPRVVLLISVTVRAS